MKRISLYSILCIVLASCSGISEPPLTTVADFIPRYTNQAMLDTMEKYKPYFLAYEAGDSISFSRENGTIDTYYVTQAATWIHCDTTIDNDTIKTAGIQLRLRQYKHSVDINVSIGRYESLHKSLFIYNNFSTWKGTLPAFSPTDDDIIITDRGLGSWCVLRRDVGIVYIQDAPHHRTWTTILPKDSI